MPDKSKWQERQTTLRESDGGIVPLSLADQAGESMPGNAGAGKAARLTRGPDRAPTVLSDGTSVLTRLDRIFADPTGVQDHPLLFSSRVRRRVKRGQSSVTYPLVLALKSEIWEPDAVTPHVRI